MLARAREKSREARLNVHWVQADMREFNLQARFSTILLPFNGLCLLQNHRDAGRLLGCVRQHLVAGGHFIFDVNNPRPERLANTGEERAFAQYDVSSPTGEDSVVATHQRSYDATTQVLDVQIEYKFSSGEQIDERLRMRMYFPDELEKLLEQSGFRVVSAFGDYEERPLTAESERQLMVCQVE
jgi:SAM-dependent methyltransferase